MSIGMTIAVKVGTGGDVDDAEDNLYLSDSVSFYVKRNPDGEIIGVRVPGDELPPDWGEDLSWTLIVLDLNEIKFIAKMKQR